MATISIAQMPLVDQACRAAVPNLIYSRETPEYPALNGTSFTFRFHGRVGLLTALHVLEHPANEQIDVVVVLGFRQPVPTARIAQALWPTAPSPKWRDAADLAVLVPLEPPVFTDPRIQPFQLDEFADLDGAAHGQLFALAGYPGNHPLGKWLDYERGATKLTLQQSLGEYQGPVEAFPGLYSLDVDTRKFGGAHGMSGGPVFQIRRQAKGNAFRPVLAGIVVRADQERVAFVGAEFVRDFLSHRQDQIWPAPSKPESQP